MYELPPIVNIKDYFLNPAQYSRLVSKIRMEIALSGLKLTIMKVLCVLTHDDR